MTLGSFIHACGRVDDRGTWGALPLILAAQLGAALFLGCNADAPTAAQAHGDARGDTGLDSGPGMMMPLDGGGASAEVDAGHGGPPVGSPDAGAEQDAGGDASTDAGPMQYDCPRVCVGTQPVCDHSRGICVGCVEDADCRDGGYCDGVTNMCRPCVENAHCTTVSESLCERGSAGLECARCDRNAHCAHLPETPYCGPLGCMGCKPDDCGGSTPRCEPVSLSCVQCIPVSEAIDCGPNSCDRATFECTGVPRGSRAPCEPCQADSECATGLGCVEQSLSSANGEVSNGAFCFPRRSTKNDCAASQPDLRPYTRQFAGPSVDGEQSNFCLPVTSCQALLDAGGSVAAKRCQLDADCGFAGVDDGECLDQGPAQGRCSYACNHTYDCPASGSTNCTGRPGVCAP